ncbi:MAG TPA: sigma factor, partial [Polyangiaceae bacterium]
MAAAAHSVCEIVESATESRFHQRRRTRRPYGKEALFSVIELAEPEAFVVYRAGPVSVEEPSDSKTSEGRLRALVTEHFDFVWRSLRRLGVPAADADDSAQEVFLTVSRKLASVEQGRERAFLFAVALRVASTSRRSRSRRPEALELDALEVQAEGLDPEELVELARARPLLDELLNELAFD